MECRLLHYAYVSTSCHTALRCQPEHDLAGRHNHAEHHRLASGRQCDLFHVAAGDPIRDDGMEPSQRANRHTGGLCPLQPHRSWRLRDPGERLQ